MADQPKYRGCEGGTMKVHRRLLDADPNYAKRLERIEEHAFRARASMQTARPGCTKIPVVVHVVYKTAAQNISKAQIDSQIAVLNKDFRKTNADVSSVPAPFAPLAGDARIEFELATVDPDGNPTDGITRTETTVNSFNSSDLMKFASSGGHDAWPSDEYLNMWVCQLSGGLLGYAQFPGGPADTDGVVMTHTGFGDTGTAAAPFDKGRTATHEVGHWLNLRHIWGDDGTGCSGSDFVSDTPNQGSSNLGKPTFPSVSCSNGPNGDMFMNYMDYVDDDTMVMFSEGQIQRMHACLDGPRMSIGVSIPCVGLVPKPFPKDLPKEFPKELPKDGLKEFPKEFPKDPPKDIPKDGPKDFPKDPLKDIPKDGPKDFPKDGPKDFPKDFPKDTPKDGPKDFPKELPKDPPKEFPKDFPKDGLKDPPKDGLKEFPLDPGPGKIIRDPGPGKGFVGDPGPGKGFLGDPGPGKGFKDPGPGKGFFGDPGPGKGFKDPGPGKGFIGDPGPGKTIFEPPKSFMEPPIDFPTFPVQPAQPLQPFQPFQPIMPFVLGTGSAPGDGGTGGGLDPATSEVLGAYAQILEQYSGLHQRGMLDAQGVAGWQQVWAAYQQLGGQ